MSDGSPFDLGNLFSGFGTGLTNVLGGTSSDLRPRILLHTPAGDTVIDPWAGGGSGGGTVTIAGIPMSYDVVWGVPTIQQSDELSTRLQTFGAIALLGLGVLFLMRR